MIFLEESRFLWGHNSPIFLPVYDQFSQASFPFLFVALYCRNITDLDVIHDVVRVEQGAFTILFVFSLFFLQSLILPPLPSASPLPPPSVPHSPLTGSSPPPLLPCPQAAALPPTPISQPAAVYEQSSRVDVVTQR